MRLKLPRARYVWLRSANRTCHSLAFCKILIGSQVKFDGKIDEKYVAQIFLISQNPYIFPFINYKDASFIEKYIFLKFIKKNLFFFQVISYLEPHLDTVRYKICL